MNKAAFIQTLTQQRASWEATLKRVISERVAIPGVENNWSVKDIIAHVTWYEREMVGLLDGRTLAGSEFWNLPHAERNSAIYQQNYRRSLEDVFNDSVNTYQQLLKLVEGLNDTELEDPHSYANMPEDWLPWQLIAENTYEHYREHAVSIQSWLDKTDKG